MVLVNDYEENKPQIDTDNCTYCKGNSAIFDRVEKRYYTSKEMCERLGTCSATIDWDDIAERNK